MLLVTLQQFTFVQIDEHRLKNSFVIWMNTSFCLGSRENIYCKVQNREINVNTKFNRRIRLCGAFF